MRLCVLFDRCAHSFDLCCALQSCKCKWCGATFIGGPARIREHHVNDPGNTHRFKLCSSKANAAEAFRARCQAAINDLQDARAKKARADEAAKQSKIAKAFLKEKQALSAKGMEAPLLSSMNNAKLLAVTKKDLDDRWCEAFSACGIAPSVVRNHRWRIAMQETIKYGKTIEYKGPEYNSQREEVLDRVVANLQEQVDAMKKKVQEFGFTLVSDGRKDSAGRPLLDYVTNTPLGPIFDGVDDMSGVDKTGENLADRLAARIDAQPPGTYVQILLDNAASCVKARRLLHTDPKYGGKYSAIVTGGCGAHALDLWMEDVSKLPAFKPLVEKVKRIVRVVYNHDIVRDAYQNKENGKRLSQFVETRFSVVSLMCEDLKDNKNALLRTVASDPWVKWKGTGHSRKADDDDGDKTNSQLARLVEDDLKDERGFWSLLDNYLNITHEVYKVLRLCDSDVPPIHEVFRRMSAARMALQQNNESTMGRTEAEMKIILDSFDKRWEMLHNPLHSVGFVLGPSNHSVNTWDGVTWEETQAYIKAYYGATSREAAAALNQLLMYKRKAGPFADEALFALVAEFSPVQWWELHGTQAKELMEVAVRVLSQVPALQMKKIKMHGMQRQLHCKKKNLGCAGVWCGRCRARMESVQLHT